MKLNLAAKEPDISLKRGLEGQLILELHSSDDQNNSFWDIQ